MSPDLHDLLERSVGDPPPERHPVAHVVRRAERSRARHRALRAVGGVLAVVLVAGAGVGAVSLERRLDRRVVAP